MLEAVVLKLLTMAAAGDLRAIQFVLDLAAKHIPAQLSLQDLMQGKKVFGWTAEDEERTSKENLLKGVTV
jgi:hypothetical protein